MEPQGRRGFLLGWVLTFAAILLFLHFFMGPPAPGGISYSEFKELLRAGTVADVVLGSERITGTIDVADPDRLARLLPEATRDRLVRDNGRFSTVRVEDPTLVEELEAMGYEVKPLVLARTGKIPDDASVVVVAGPRSDFFGPEVDALDGYLGRGGKLLVMLDPPVRPGQQDPEALKRFLGKQGIQVATNVVIEMNPLRQMATGSADVVIIDAFESHPITRDLKIVALFPGVRSVTLADKPPTGVVGQRLAVTSQDSFGETDFAALRRGEAKPDAGDARGPLPVAVVATRDKARVVAYGTSLLAVNQYFAQPGNRDLVLNTVPWLAEEEHLISIQPMDTKSTPVFLSAQQKQTVQWLAIGVVPGVFLLGGIVAVVRRRSAK